MGAGLLLRPKALYLSLNAAVYAPYAVMAGFAKARWRVPDHFAGYFVALSIVGFPGSLLWTALADRTGRLRGVLVGTTLCHAAFILATFALTVPLSAAGDALRLGVFGSLSLMASFFSAGLYPLVDRSVMAILARETDVPLESYSRQRLFGIISQTAVIAGMGVLVDAFDYGAAFLFFALAVAVFLLCVMVTVPRDFALPAVSVKGKSDASASVRRESDKSAAGSKNLDPDAKLQPDVSVAATSVCTKDASVYSVSDDQPHADVQSAVADVVDETKEFSKSVDTAVVSQRDTDARPESCKHMASATSDGSEMASGASAKSASDCRKQTEETCNTPGRLSLLMRLPLSFHIFLCAVLVAGVVRGVLGNFLYLYLNSVFEMSFRTACLVQVGRVVPEVAMFFASSPLVRLWGAPAVFQLGALAGVVRAGSYAALAFFRVDGRSGAAAAFVLEMLKGASNACIVAGGVRIAHDAAPPGLEASAQGAFTGVHAYLANALSGVFGGVLLHVQRGDRSAAYAWMLAATAALGLCGVLLYLPFIQRHVRHSV